MSQPCKCAHVAMRKPADGGSAINVLTGKPKCPICYGTGHVITCPRCDGAGMKDSAVCVKCSGHGKVGAAA